MQKSYYQKILKHVEQEIKILEKFTSKYQNFTNQIRDSYSLMPSDLKDFIDPIDVSDDEFARRWQSVPFVPKLIDEEKYTMITDRGERVRSKSELAIANALNRMNIPYRYECPLELKNGRIIYPDFTVLNVRTRTVYYLEHRGKMDAPTYASYPL